MCLCVYLHVCLSPGADGWLQKNMFVHNFQTIPGTLHMCTCTSCLGSVPNPGLVLTHGDASSASSGQAMYLKKFHRCHPCIRWELWAPRNMLGAPSWCGKGGVIEAPCNQFVLAIDECCNLCCKKAQIVEQMGCTLRPPPPPHNPPRNEDCK